MSPLRELLLFTMTLAGLVVLSRWISRQVQVLVLRLTGDENVSHMAYYLLFLPGIALHELSHAAMARLLGLRVGDFSLGPRRATRTSIELGSVTISRSDAFRESLVGLAPFLAGTAVLVLICYRVFDVGAMGLALRTGGWDAALGGVGAFRRAPDFGVWAYLIFVVSNAMMPSPSDRRPWLTAGIYLALALGVLYLLVGIPSMPSLARDLRPALSYEAVGLFQALTLAFSFTLIVDLFVAAAIFVADQVVIALQR
jgi:hypothetical protein